MTEANLSRSLNLLRIYFLSVNRSQLRTPGRLTRTRPGAGYP